MVVGEYSNMETATAQTSSEMYTDKYFRKNFVYDARRDGVWKQVCDFLQPRFIPPNASVLDLGAGYCNFINNINAKEKHAVDIFQDLKKYAHPDVHIHNQSCTDLSNFSDGLFDVVFASNLFEHLERSEFYSTLTQVHRVLKTGGKLLCLQPNFRYCYREYFDDFTHVQIFTDRSLSEVLESFDFSIYRQYARFLPVNMKSRLRFPIPFLHSIIRLYLRSPFKPKAGQMLIVAQKV